MAFRTDFLWMGGKHLDWLETCLLPRKGGEALSRRKSPGFLILGLIGSVQP
jgi:hypothetical protein